VGSVFALVGGLLLIWRESFAKRISLALVSFAVGSLIGATFLELIPEAVHGKGYGEIAPFIICGIFAMFLFEKILNIPHAHGEDTEEHSDVEEAHSPKHARERAITGTVIFGDSLHNFIDGVLIALSFVVSPEVGVATTVAVFFHEVPQEIGDFGILVHLGYERSKVLLYNFLSALATPIGAITGYFLSDFLEPYLPVFLAFAAGTFLYIAIADLLPELRHKHRGGSGMIHFAGMVLGVVVIAVIGIWIPE
jgi:zinc and cadmium transporter